MAARAWDYVIVGGGSAGSVLANRLSADPSTRVLVLEAGRPDYRFDPFIHMPAALTFPIGSRFYDWQYESEPEPFMDGRRIYHARGKVLGGLELDQRDDLPARQSARLRALGGRSRDGHVVIRSLPALLQADGGLHRGGGGRPVARSRRAARVWSEDRPRARCSRPGSKRRSRPAIPDDRRQRLSPGRLRRVRSEHPAGSADERRASVSPSRPRQAEPDRADSDVRHGIFVSRTGEPRAWRSSGVAAGRRRSVPAR